MGTAPYITTIITGRSITLAPIPTKRVEMFMVGSIVMVALILNYVMERYYDITIPTSH